MSISDFEQSLWELALLINPTHLANITTTKLNSYYQDTILDMRKVVLVQNLFNDIYNNWTDHQIRYQQNRRRQIENGEITEQQLLEEEMCEENESELEYMSDEDGQSTDEERYDSMEFSNKEKPVENKENINNTNNSNVIITNDNTVIQLPVRKSSVKHKNNGKPIKANDSDNQPIVDSKNEPNAINIKEVATESSVNKVESKINNSIPTKEISKKSSKNIIENVVKEQKNNEQKENVKQITLDFSSKDAANKIEINTIEDSSDDESKKSKKEHSRRKKIEREPRKDSLKANVKLSDEKCNEVLKELQKSGVISSGNEEKLYKKSDSAVSLDEKSENSINANSASANGSFVIRSFNIPSQQNIPQQNIPQQNVSQQNVSSASVSIIDESSSVKTNNPMPTGRELIPVRKSSSFKKNKPTYRLSDKDVSIKNKYKLNKDEPKKEENNKSKQSSDQSKVHLRPKKISEPPTMQRRSMDELLFQFADVMDIVSLIPHIVGDDDLLGNDLTFNSSSLNSKVQTKDSNGNVIEEKPRRRPSRAPTPPPTVVSNGKEYEIYSIPSERHQKYIKKKEEMEKSNKRRSSLKFEYHEFEELKRQQELAGYDVSGDVPVTDRKAREAKEKEAKEREAKEREAKEREAKQAKEAKGRESKQTKESKESSSKGSPQSYYKRNSYASSGRNSPTTSSPSMSYTSSSAGSCGSTMKMDVLSGCMLSSSSSSNSSSNNHSSSKSSGKRSSRFFSLTKSKSKSSKDKEKDKANKENISNNINGKNYLVRRKSTEKSNSSVRRYMLGGSQESSPSLSSSPSPSSSSSSSIKKSYSSTTLSKYDLPHMSSLSSNQESTSRRYANGERSKTTPISSSKSSPGLLDINLSSSSSKQNSKNSTSEIDKFFDNVFRIDWSL